MKEDAQGIPAKKQQSQDPALKVTDFQLVLSPLCPWLWTFFFFFFLPMPACRISVLQQELSQGHGSESPESQPLGHQETPRSFILNKTKISAICKLTKRNNQTSETVRCKKNSTGTRVLAVQARNTAASHTIPSSFSYRRTPLIHKKSIMHYYFYWSTIALQHCVGLCCRAEWIRSMFTYALLSLLSLPPTPLVITEHWAELPAV